MRLSVLLLLLVSTSAAAQTTAQTAEPLEFSDVTPVLIGGIEALQRGLVYPDADRAAGTEGRVIVRFVVDADGVPGRIEVARSVSAGLDSAAVAAVRAARFEPGRDGGEAVSVRLVLPVTFRLGRGAAVAKPGVAALTARLGRPCCSVPADSGAVLGGAGRLVWRAPEAGVSSLDARIEGDTLRAVTVAYTPGEPSPLDALARQIVETRVQPDADGFFLAFGLNSGGMSTAADVRLDAPRNRLTLRYPACLTLPGVGCVSVFPVLVGGLQAVQAGIDYPHAARRAGTSGVVVVAFVIQPDGSATDVRVVSNSGEREIGGRELGYAAVRAVRGSRFLLPPGQGPVPFAIPLTFRTR